MSENFHSFFLEQFAPQNFEKIRIKFKNNFDTIILYLF
mgnify:CR=1 FL=1